MLFNAFVLALRAITRNVMRSFLTTLGIVIGIASVIILVTIGDGATQSITGSIEKLGSNMLTIAPGQRQRGGQASVAPLFKNEDVRILKRELSDIKAVAPQLSRSVTAVVGNENHTTTLYGTDNDYLIVKDWALQEGRSFSGSEIRSGKAVCLIGATIIEKLFERESAVGKSIRFKDMSCIVIGVLEDKGASTFGQDQDDAIIMPIKTFQRRISGSTDVTLIQVSMLDNVESSVVIDQINTILRERRHLREGDENDFEVHDLKEIIKTVSETTQILTLLLGAIAAISLLVGGIGIMNIMLVSVTERTREIGIRLAIGAFEKEVLTQFLVEAIVLSSLGGVIGIIIGLLGAWGITTAIDIPLVISMKVITMAFGFASFVGIVFGYFPARKAAKLDPIDALRHE